MINRYTVFGQPIDHSLSPAIHQLFGDLTQRRIHYDKTLGTPDTFLDLVKAFQVSGGKGCNVTLPFKELAFEACDRLHESAVEANAVNTIHMLRDGTRVGHNTDGHGLVRDLKQNLLCKLPGKHLLIVGAGGATRGVLGPLLRTHPASLTITNRTSSKALDLARRFGDVGPVRGLTLDALTNPDSLPLTAINGYDIVINATSASLGGEVPALPTSGLFAPQALAYDMMYSKTDTAFMSWARAHGADRVAQGFGMLVEQAAEAFLVWEGVRPKTRMAYGKLRCVLDNA